MVVIDKTKAVSGRNLEEQILTFEKDLIKHALIGAQGSVTNAARALGLLYPTLTYMLRTRHKDLMKYRTPVKRRQP